MIGKNKKIHIDDARPDMVLAEHILDSRGEVLLPSGGVLSDSTLTSLRRRGIDFLHVVDDTVSLEELAAERERTMHRLVSLFRKCGTDGNAAALYRYVRCYRTGEQA